MHTLHTYSHSKHAPTLSPNRLRRTRPSPSQTPVVVEKIVPIVKWVGGKTRLCPQLKRLLPEGVEHMRHVEAFAGGAGFFFHRRPTHSLLLDINKDLMTMYRAVRDGVEEVIEALHPFSVAHNEATYYEVRSTYNQWAGRMPDVERAAMFIYLNKTCFNGLHRVNRQGHFNVPMGRYKAPRIVDEDNLRAASLLLKHTDLVFGSFEELLGAAKSGDFIYLDPPYEPASATANFTAYDSLGFAREEQARLREIFAILDQRGCKLMLSNSDVPWIRELYGDYPIHTVAAPRLINCDAQKRGLVSEVVVTNYSPA